MKKYFFIKGKLCILTLAAILMPLTACAAEAPDRFNELRRELFMHDIKSSGSKEGSKGAQSKHLRDNPHLLDQVIDQAVQRVASTVQGKPYNLSSHQKKIAALLRLVGGRPLRGPSKISAQEDQADAVGDPNVAVGPAQQPQPRLAEVGQVQEGYPPIFLMIGFAVGMVVGFVVSAIFGKDFSQAIKRFRRAKKRPRREK